MGEIIRHEIDIKNGKVIKCPVCNTKVCVENSDERIYRKTGFLYQNKKTGLNRLKCKQCNHTFEFIS